MRTDITQYTVRAVRALRCTSVSFSRQLYVLVRYQARYTPDMDALAEKLDARLRKGRPETATEARELIAELIDLADAETLDFARSRHVEQAVLDSLDESTPG